MASPICCRLCLSKHISRINLASCWTTSRCNYANSSDESSRTPKIVVSEDGSTIACWHPEPTFPYEHTRPLPRKESEMKQGDSVLKVQHVKDYDNRFRPDGPTNEELMKMFHTSVHQWRPIPRKRFPALNKPPKEDREGI